MGDSTDKVHDRLVAIYADLERHRERQRKVAAQIVELEQQFGVLLEALRLSDAELPEFAQASSTDLRRKSGRTRAIDAALQVVEPGETVDAHEVVRRLQVSEVAFESAHPANAIATAMARSPSFKKIGRGRFERLPQEERQTIRK